MKNKADLDKNGSVPMLKLSHNPSHTRKSFLSIHDNNDFFDITHASFMTESWTQKTPPFEFLDLKIFKVFPCSNRNPHNYKNCCYYHNIKDRRRNNIVYGSELCEYIEKNQECPRGENCNRSHNFIEVLYHPEKYKSKFCSFFPNNVHNCEYLHYCSFAHSEHEITINLIHNYDFDDDFYMFHYKTVWCPFNLSQHNKALCVYAHNWQDFRRKPDLYFYDFTPCDKWKNTEMILNYENGCPKNFECNKSHGWKESEFHPLNYKTRLCSISKPCTKSKDCPFYHTPSEKRIIPPLFENKFFCYIPRNRIITNTFKIKATSRHGSVLSTFSLAPFLALNPVTEIDELKNENYSNKFISELMNNSTKLPSEPFSQLSLISKDQEKGNIKDKRRASDPEQPFKSFSARNEEENLYYVRFKSVADKYDHSRDLEKDIMKILVSDESDEDNEEFEKK